MSRIIRPFFRKVGQAVDQQCVSNSGRPLDLYIRKKLGLLKQQLERTGQKFGVWRKTLPDGTRLEFTVNLNGAQPVLLAKVVSSMGAVSITEYLLVESGLIVLPTVFELDADPMLPAILKPLTPQQDAAAQVEWQMLDKGDGSPLFSYRDYLQQSMTSAALPSSVTEEKKLYAGRVRIFELTGKLAFAAKVKATGLEKCPDSPLLAFLEQQRYLEGITIPESVYNSYWLYTKEVGIYYLIHSLLGELRAYPITTSNRIAKAYIRQLKSGQWMPDQKEYQRLEAYVLATCDISGDYYVSGAAQLIGEPLYYGWKPTWNGTKATIITHERFRYDEGGNLLPVIARQYTASVDENPEYDSGVPISETNAPFFVSVALDEQHEWTPRLTTDPIWIPSPTRALAASFPWFPHSCEETMTPQLCQSVPIYCWYDYQNRLVRITYSHDPNEDITNEYGADRTLWEAAVNWCSSSGSYTAPNFEYTVGGNTTYLAFEVGSPVEPFASYADEEFIGDEPSLRLGGASAAQYEKRTLTWERGGFQDCSTGYSCFRVDQYFGLIPCEAGDWTLPPVGERECTLNRIGLKADYAAVERYLELILATTNTINNRPALVIANGNAEAAFILNRHVVNGQKNRDFKYWTMVERNRSELGETKHYYHTFNNQTGGVAGVGNPCAVTPGNLPGAGVYYTSTMSISRAYADRWGMHAYPDLSAEELTGVAQEPNGLYLIWFNPVCLDPTEFVGYFLTIGGVEGPKFWQRNPGRLDFQDFGSNIEEEWDFEHFKLFAGWQ